DPGGEESRRAEEDRGPGNSRIHQAAGAVPALPAAVVSGGGKGRSSTPRPRAALSRAAEAASSCAGPRALTVARLGMTRWNESAVRAPGKSVIQHWIFLRSILTRVMICQTTLLGSCIAQDRDSQPVRPQPKIQ